MNNILDISYWDFFVCYRVIDTILILKQYSKYFILNLNIFEPFAVAEIMFFVINKKQTKVLDVRQYHIRKEGWQY